MFVYGVTSTGIFCRPTCPSRRPRRDRARFFAHGDLAAAEGFRPCRRCRPQEASTSTPALDRIRGTAHTIASRRGSSVSLSALARAAGIGQHQLLRSFKQALGITPREYADACRTGCLKSALKSGLGVADAGYAAGYGSGSRVYERAPSMLGMTPARYAAGGKGETVRYAIARSSIGHVLVASTARGICAVTLGDNAETLSRGLAGEFPGARVERADESLTAAEGRGGQRRWPRARSATPPRCPGHRVSATRVEGIAAHPARTDPHVWGGRRAHRPSDRNPRRRSRLRVESCCADRPVPPGRARGRKRQRLPVGLRA